MPAVNLPLLHFIQFLTVIIIIIMIIIIISLVYPPLKSFRFIGDTVECIGDRFRVRVGIRD
jgi:hypothetical protein